MLAETTTTKEDRWLFELTHEGDLFCTVCLPRDKEWLEHKLEGLGPVYQRLHKCEAWQNAIAEAVVGISRAIAGTCAERGQVWPGPTGTHCDAEVHCFDVAHSPSYGSAAVLVPEGGAASLLLLFVRGQIPETPCNKCPACNVS